MAMKLGSGPTFSILRLQAAGLAGALVLTACTTTGPVQQAPRPVVQVPQTQRPAPVIKDPVIEAPTPEVTPQTQPEPVIMRGGLTPPHMKGRDVKRLALLLPFSAKSERLRSEAASMLKAAEMAVFNRDEPDVLLIALDTGATPSGAASAARAALKSGADVILGPVLAGSVKAASREARKTKTPVIAFSTDQSVAGNGTYLLSFPPEAEVERIVEYAASTGAQNFAFLGPESAYGKRVSAAYQRSVRAMGGEVTASDSYKGNDISVMQAPAKKIADFYKAREEETGGQGRMAFEAIILPEGGTPLRSLAPLLPYYDIDPAEVQFLGTGLWHKEETVREPALNGGIFAGPAQDTRQAFVSNYDRHFGEDPSRLASLAFDAVNVGTIVADGRPSGRHIRAQDRAGFYGADGLIRFKSNGTPDRGLAIYQIRNGQFIIIDPAPRTVVGPN